LVCAALDKSPGYPESIATVYLRLFIFCWFCFSTYREKRRNEHQFSDRSRKIARVRSALLLATMAFSVATNNRFDLFVDEDEEPDELLTKQQRQVVAERQRRDSEKKSARAAPGGKQVPAKGQTQQNVGRSAASSNSATASSDNNISRTCGQLA